MNAPRLVKDIYPGAAGSSPGGLLEFNNTLFFSANDGVAGFELWSSNGSSGGTLLVKDVTIGATGSFPRRFIKAGNQFFFTANRTVFAEDLWVSDGTTAGTRKINGVNPANFDFTNLATLNGRLFFVNGAGDFVDELWSSDGSDFGTSLVREIGTLSFTGAKPRDLTRAGNHLYFSADDGISGRELWRTDGTEAGTELVSDIALGGSQFFPNESNPENLTALGDRLFFTANDGFFGIELWVSDGTDFGTQLVREIVPGYNVLNGSGPSNLTAVGSNLFFTVNDEFSGDELWVTDGSFSGTRLVRDILPGIGGSGPRNLTAVGGTIFFTANDGLTGYELWKSDGTTEGTVRVKDILTPSGPDFDGTAGFGPQNLTAINNKLYFSAETFTSNGRTGLEPWVSDGTEAGTVMIADIQTNELFFPGSEPSGFTAVGNQIYFSATRDGNGSELWAVEPASGAGTGSGSGGSGSGTGSAQNPASIPGQGRLSGTPGPNEFRFLTKDSFDRAGADFVTNFNANEGDRLLFSREALPGVRNASLRLANNKKRFKKALKGSSSLVYNQLTGELFYNANGKRSGFGEGGLLAILEGAPPLPGTSIALV
jgi:ELWxxDGT repeat protein